MRSQNKKMFSRKEIQFLFLKYLAWDFWRYKWHKWYLCYHFEFQHLKSNINILPFLFGFNERDATSSLVWCSCKITCNQKKWSSVILQRRFESNAIKKRMKICALKINYSCDTNILRKSNEYEGIQPKMNEYVSMQLHEK